MCIVFYVFDSFQLFLNEFLNNPSLHERLAENINRTLSLRTGEKRNRKKSGRSLKTPASPRSSKPGKSEAPSIAEESESNISQSLDTQHLNTFLDDILNINVRKLCLDFICCLMNFLWYFSQAKVFYELTFNFLFCCCLCVSFDKNKS